jgi:hypothetical protein
MKNPTVEQVEFVIKKLQSVIEQAGREGAFDITETSVYSKEHKYECGTVHCVGGWYAFANLRRKFITDKFKKGFVDFRDGAELLANDLGFDNAYALKCWARDNPRIWGNSVGYCMFSETYAYDDTGFDGVIMQWQTVRDNLPKTA